MPVLTVFIARLQPLMRDDLATIAAARAQSDFTLVLVTGAARPRSVRAPLSFQAISAGLQRAFPDADDLLVLPLLDTLYDDATWVSHVRTCVDYALAPLRWTDTEIVLVGQTPANARHTLTLFPDWGSALSREETDGLSVFYDNACPGLSETDRTTLMEARKALLDEHQRLDAASAALGYPIVLNTADAVVVQSNMLLVVEENGLLRLPGAHVGVAETGLETALRAARTKGGLDMPKGALSGRLTNRQVFDHPKRSDRGRIRTEAFVFTLPTSGKMESVKPTGGRWLAFHDVHPSLFFEDHYDICQALLRGIWCDQRSLLE